jgi:hypothetical protein
MADAPNPSPDPTASSGHSPGDAESPGSAPAAPGADGTDGAEAGPADVKARFRDVLQRKQSQHADGVGPAASASSAARAVAEFLRLRDYSA